MQWNDLFNEYEQYAGSYSSYDGNTVLSMDFSNPLNPNINDFSGYNSKMGVREHPIYHTKRTHDGNDYAIPSGTPIYAVADGVVENATPQTNSSGQVVGYGNRVWINHNNAARTTYNHLSEVIVQEGDTVHKGDLIGYSGNSGSSTGPHLHFEVRKWKNASPENNWGNTPTVLDLNLQIRQSNESTQIFDSIDDYKSSYTQKAKMDFLSEIPSYKHTEDKANAITELNSENFKDFFRNPQEETGQFDPLKELLYKDEYNQKIDESITNNWNKLNTKLDEIQSNNALTLDEFETNINESLEQSLNAISRADDGLSNQLDSNLTKERSISKNLETYIWKTEGDDKVRDSHADLNDKVMIWGEGIEPGEDFGCRCKAHPSDLTIEEAREIQEDYGSWFQDWLDSGKTQKDGFDIEDIHYDSNYDEEGGMSEANQFYDNSLGEWVQDSDGDHRYDLDDLVSHIADKNYDRA